MRKTFLLVIIFTLALAPLAAQTVTVSSPNGGEPWALNTPQNITWNFTNAGSVKVDIILRNSGGKVGVIKSQVALSAGSWPWPLVGKLEDGTMVAPGSDYIVRIRAGNTCSDDSNQPFSITGAAPPSGPASITVTSPNGGENWANGIMKDITWNTANWTGTVRLELWQKAVDKKKGDIAMGIPSSPGKYSWPVGKLVSGLAGIGSDYKVRVVREYKAGTRTPIPLSPLMDESDGSFLISFLAMRDPQRDVQPIKVITPKEGDIFTYGPYAGPNTYGILLNIQWETQYPLPFLIELYDNGGNKLWDTEVESEVKSQKLRETNLYFLKYLFVPENSSPGWYKIRVQTVDSRKQSGFSGKFRIRGVKVLEETIPAGIDNHYHSESTDYSFGGLFSGGMKNQFNNLPARARVGFYNRYETGSSGQYAYLGSVFRSQLTVNLDRFKKLKGKFLSADLYIERKEHYNNYQNGINSCGDKLYVLSGPWGKNNVMETPGVLLQSLSQSLIGQHIDVTSWFNAWLSGQSPNYGLLLTALSESFKHENNWCVSYFHVAFNIKFQTEE